ncbi:MAG: hypothetical protein ACT4O1_01245 [Gemmatimonadota bacterium]
MIAISTIFLPPLFAVVPGEDQRRNETGGEYDGRDARNRGGPVEAAAQKVDELEQRPCARRVCNGPLHELALP